MMSGYRLARTAASVFLGLATLTTVPSRAQTWADTAYRYRRPLSITTTVPEGLGSGSVVAFPYVPNYGPFNGRTRADGRDVKVVYQNGSTTAEPPQVVLPMGPASARVLFALQAAVPTPPPYNLQEDTSAGATSYDSLPKGTALAFPPDAAWPLDDNAATVALPFRFPLRDQSSDKLTISIDGYLGLGAADPGRPSDSNTGSDKFIVMPFQSDFAIYAAGLGVYYYADATQAVIRWEVQESSGGAGPLIARFACILKPDGSIRFVYGAPCFSPNGLIADGPNGGYDPLRYGVGVNDPSSPITEPYFNPLATPPAVDFAGHPDILYTQTLPLTTISGYWVYYGNPSDTGARTAPTTGLQGCDFSDAALHGWESLQDPTGTGGAAADVRVNTDPTFGSELRIDASKYHHPMAYWKGMAPVASAISYSKVRRAGEFAIVHRFNTQTLSSSDGSIGNYLTGADIPGLGINWNAWGSAYALVTSLQATEEGTTGKRHPGPDGFSPGIPFQQDDINTYQYHIESVIDDPISTHTVIKGRGWPSVERFVPTDPGSPLLTADSNAKIPASQPLPAGKFAILQYGGTTYLKWVYVVSNPYAEDLVYAPGAESAQPPPTNKGTLKGTVVDAASLAGIPNVTVTIRPVAGGADLSAVTDAAGQYTQYVDPGSYNLTFAAAGYTPATVATGAIAVGGTSTANASLSAPNLLLNPGFETVDAAFTGKPKSWYRRNLGNNAGPSPSASVLPWEFTTIGPHAGARAVGISASSGIASWELEGTTVGANNTDNRGRGTFPATVPGETYRISSWVKKVGSGGTARLHGQPMSGTGDQDANLAAGAQSVSLTADTGGAWVQLSREIVAASAWTSLRLYGVDIPSGQHVYFDDVSLSRIQAGTYSGTVQDAAGAPMAGVAVGLREGTANGLACPLVAVTTDGVGRFNFPFIPAPGAAYALQVWKDGKGASANIPLGPIGTSQAITYDAKAFANVAAGKPIVASSGDDNGGGLAANAVDGNEDTRWINGTSNPVGNATGSSNPAWIVIDLGQAVPIAQISMIWERAKPGAYQIRVGSTPPGAGFSAAAAAAYGTLIFDTTSGMNSYVPEYNSPQRIDVITPPSIPANVSARYVEVYMSAFGAFGNYSLYEMKVEVPVGTVTGRVLDSATMQPVANAYVGPYPFVRIRPWTPEVYVKTDANGRFTYAGASIPLQLAVHKADDTKPTAADPYLVQPFTATPTTAGATAPDILLQPNVDPDGNALKSSATVVIDNGANPGTDTYLPTTAVDVGNDPNMPAQAVDGDISKPWDINTSDTISGKIHSITEGPGYLRFGLQTTLAAPANLGAIDLYWMQNGYTFGYYVEVQRPNSSTWEKVYEVYNKAGGYGTRDDSLNDAFTVNPIRFTARPVARVRIIFTKKGERSYGGDYGSEVLLSEMFGLTSTAPSSQDVLTALRVASGLEAGPTAGSDAWTRLNQAASGASANRIDVLDAVALAKQMR